jgi:hypothetical protein
MIDSQLSALANELIALFDDASTEEMASVLRRDSPWNPLEATITLHCP